MQFSDIFTFIDKNYTNHYSSFEFVVLFFPFFLMNASFKFLLLKSTSLSSK
jgi:hypothetical protein